MAFNSILFLCTFDFWQHSRHCTGRMGRYYTKRQVYSLLPPSISMIDQYSTDWLAPLEMPDVPTKQNKLKWPNKKRQGNKSGIGDGRHGCVRRRVRGGKVKVLLFLRLFPLKCPDEADPARGVRRVRTVNGQRDTAHDIPGADRDRAQLRRRRRQTKEEDSAQC